MAELLTESLKKIAKGAIIVLVGIAIGRLFGLATRIIIARYVSQTEYGIFALAFVILNILVLISGLGLQQGTARQIAYFRGKNDTEKVSRIMFSSIQIVTVASVLAFILLFFSADFVSVTIFHSPELRIPLKIVSVAVPFWVIINILSSIFRGFDNVVPRVYFLEISRPAFFTLLLIVIMLLNLPFLSILYALLISFIVASLAFIIYASKKTPLPIKINVGFNSSDTELITFSLPLMAVLIMNMIIEWTDTLMLGFFKDPDAVGLYNVAIPLAQLIPTISFSLALIYVPVLSKLYAKNLFGEMGKSYLVSTKWMFFVSYPLFLMLFLFPESILSLFFGSSYAESARALQILSLGFIFRTFCGATGATLTALGKTRLIMLASVIAVVLNILLNISLIPLWGIVGAAIASMIAYMGSNTFNVIKLYQHLRIHPFTKTYLKPVILSTIVVIIIYVLIVNFVSVTYWMLPLIFVLFYAVCVLSLFVTKNLGKQDVEMVLEIASRTGLDGIKKLNNIIRRFF